MIRSTHNHLPGTYVIGDPCYFENPIVLGVVCTGGDGCWWDKEGRKIGEDSGRIAIMSERTEIPENKICPERVFGHKITFKDEWALNVNINVPSVRYHSNPPNCEN